MSAVSDEVGKLEEVLRVEDLGIAPIPPDRRDATALQQFWIWAGANLVPLSWVVGTVGVALGLSLLETIVVVVLGQALGALIFGFFALMGHRTGVNQMVLARATFGRRGAYLPTAIQMLLALGWVGANTYVVLDLALGVLEHLGIDAGTGSQYALAVAIMIVQVVIGVWGFYAIRTFEKYTVPVVAAIMVVMTVLVALKLEQVDWTTSTVSGTEKLTAISQLITAVGVGWGMGWIAWASDYTRFTAQSVTKRRLFVASCLGVLVPLAWLAVLGAVSGAATNAGDPADIVAEFFGVMTIPVLIAILHGPVGSNVLNIYTASLGLLSLDVKVRRVVASTLAGAVAFVALIVFIESASFSAGFINYMSSMVIWMSPWAGVTLVDYYGVRRQNIDVDALYAPPSRSRYGDVNWRAVGAFLLGLLAAWMFEYGYVDAFRGPIARAAGDVDLSWLAGLLVGGGTYALLVRRSLRRDPGRITGSGLDGERA